MLQFAVPRRTFSLLAIVAVVGISLAIVLAERARADLVHSNHWVIHTFQVQQTFHALLATVLHTEKRCLRIAANDDAEGRTACDHSHRPHESDVA